MCRQRGGGQRGGESCIYRPHPPTGYDLRVLSYLLATIVSLRPTGPVSTDSASFCSLIVVGSSGASVRLRRLWLFFVNSPSLPSASSLLFDFLEFQINRLLLDSVVYWVPHFESEHLTDGLEEKHRRPPPSNSPLLHM